MEDPGFRPLGVLRKFGPLGDVDQHFADGAAFDRRVGGGGLLEREAVQRQSGVRLPTCRAPSAAAAATSATAASLTAAGTV